MIVITRATLDMNTMQWTAVESHDYDGPVALCKGDSTAKDAEKQQMSFQTQLMGLFQQQFGKQAEVFKFLKNTLKPMITNPTGFSAKSMALQRASATDQNSANYQNAERTLNAKISSQGGMDQLGSGVNTQLYAGLLEAEAGDKTRSQNDITLANENLKQQNYWNAINGLNGVATEYNPQSYAGASNQAAGGVADLSKAYTQSQQSGLMGLVGSLAGAAGTAYAGRHG